MYVPMYVHIWSMYLLPHIAIFLQLVIFVNHSQNMGIEDIFMTDPEVIAILIIMISWTVTFMK